VAGHLSLCARWESAVGRRSTAHSAYDSSVEWVWTWSGRCFGYRADDNLWTHDGRHVGRFDGDEVYGADGAYLGEVHGERLIRNRSKAGWRRSAFSPLTRRVAYVKYVDYAGYVMLAGFEEFPHLEK
jgi:hypothetical protein